VRKSLDTTISDRPSRPFRINVFITPAVHERTTATTLEGPPRKELREPEIFLRILLGAPQDGMRSDDKNAPQVAVALLGDRPKLLLAPG
jgi:hypothetical protein